MKRAPFHFAIGKRFMNRAGAVVRIMYIHSEIHHELNPNKWPFLVVIIERCADGTLPREGDALKISLCPDGRYFPHDRESSLDLIAEVVKLKST